MKNIEKMSDRELRAELGEARQRARTSLDINAIKAQYPPEYINALGKKDMDNIRAMIIDIERMTETNDD